MTTPVLLLVFNRPDHTRKVFERVREMQPESLYISADGARTHVPEDLEKCASVRAIIEKVDWPCTVYTNFMPENHGCRRAVQAGISWFFQHVEAGIILEDDCLPDPSFFGFCSELLDRYRNDHAVMHIAGNNPDPQVCRGLEASYLFSRFSLIWGWATWRRAWQQYDPNFTGLENMWKDPSGGLSRLVGDKAARRYMFDKFLRTRSGELDTWDYAWFFTILKSNGLCIVPKVNLVKNIGFDDTGTHTSKELAVYRHNEVSSIGAHLVHPTKQTPDSAIELAFFHASQKDKLRLWIRRLAPWFFYKTGR